MKKLILLLLFIPLISFGQELFFIGESSYQSTQKYVLKSDVFGEDLTILFAKNNDSKYIVVQTDRLLELKFGDKLLIYLNNGDIISLTSPYKTDYVNRTTTGMYLLSDENVNKLKEININSIAYSLKYPNTRDTKYMAKLTSGDTTFLVKDF
tara:strand:- start:312 stop:767 length:456 start_codon:yes stop_codon:yes gene_type:complete